MIFDLDNVLFNHHLIIQHLQGGLSPIRLARFPLEQLLIMILSRKRFIRNELDLVALCYVKAQKTAYLASDKPK